MIPPRAYMELKWWDYRIRNRRSHRAMQSRRARVTDAGYSYKPFDDTRSLFIHIPKCAGVSVCRALYGNLAGGHTPLDRYLEAFEPRLIERYFKFTIVRNPWDRLVSAYFFLKAGGFGDRDAQWFDRELSAYADFDDFVKRWLNRANIWKWHHFKPQQHFMEDKRRKIDLDFIGLFENLAEDFAHIAHRVGVSATLQSTNPSRHRDYRNYYSDETREMVAAVYAEDIALLGYDFDNANLPDQLAAR